MSAPWIGRVDCDHIEIARERQVLKAVVQNKAIGGEVFNRITTRAGALDVAGYRSGSEWLRCEQIRFVTSLGGCRDYRVAVGHNDLALRVLAPVAASQNADVLAFSRNRFRNPFDERRFPRAADSHVADADHGTIEFCRVERAA